MPIRILHTADLHLDSPLASLAMRDPDLRARVGAASRLALERMVSLCIEGDVSALLIAGDLYDRAERSMKTGAFLARQFERLAERGIAVFYIKGNHDAENPVTGEMRLPGNVHVFGPKGGKANLPGTDIWIHGVSFADRHAPHSLLPLFGDPVPGVVNIAMLHTSLAGAPGHDPYAPCTVAELVARGFDYWALGHVHKRQIHNEKPWVVMPGAPQGRDIGEAGPGSATLLEIADDGRIEISQASTSSVEFARSSLDISGCPDESALERTLAAHLADAAGGVELRILRLRLTGGSPFAWRLARDLDRWRETCARIAADDGRIFVDSLELDLDAGQEAAPADAVGELQAMMTAMAREEGFLEEAREELRLILAKLPRERRDAFAADEAAETALLERLAADAAGLMAARMRGASQAAD